MGAIGSVLILMFGILQILLLLTLPSWVSGVELQLLFLFPIFFMGLAVAWAFK